MSVESIRRILRTATMLVWASGVVGIITYDYSGKHVSPADIIRGAILIATITCTTAIVEVIVGITGRIIQAMPAADEVAARALLAGQQIAQEQHDAESELPRISDYRR